MSNKTDFDACLAAIQAIPSADVKEPSMPVDVYVQEADNLYTWLQPDLPVLIAKGISKALIQHLPVRAGALRESQSLWMKESRSQDTWNQQSPAAYELRNDLIADFRYAYRNDASLLACVSEISAGEGHEDMVQDLNDLAVLGQANTGALTAIGFNLGTLATAATLSDQMAQLLAEVNGHKTAGHEGKYLRDQAYTYLKTLVDQVRECGKYAFRKDEKRLKGYYSRYWQKAKSNGKTNDTVTEEPAN